MKKLLLVLTAFVLLAVSLQAQDAKAAKRALGMYNLDPSNKAKLKEAVDAIQGEPTGEDAADPGFYNLKGDIYNTVASQIAVTKQTGLGSLEDLPEVDMVAIKAFKAYKTALEKNAAMSPKKYIASDVLKGLQEAQGHLYNFGIYAFEAKDYGAAYANFSAGLEVHDILKKNGQASTLDDPGALLDQKYVAGLAALNFNRTDLAEPLFEELYQARYDKPGIYEALYTLKSNNDGPEDAYRYLEVGREKYPEDVSLLFAEINHFLRQKKLDELVVKLRQAIEKEPENLTLYTTLGGVYDQLFQRASQEGNGEQAEQYFSEALNYYNQASQKDPNNFDVMYSIGALYYNKAAGKTLELNKLSDDFSQEGMKKYEAKKAEVFAEFDKALPYFQKAESINPNDMNTLVALKEIYARKDDQPMSNEFKTRMEKVQSGGSNDSPYFNK